MRNSKHYKSYQQKSEVISLPQTPSFQHHYPTKEAVQIDKKTKTKLEKNSNDTDHKSL